MIFYHSICFVFGLVSQNLLTSIDKIDVLEPNTALFMNMHIYLLPISTLKNTVTKHDNKEDAKIEL